MITKLKEVTFVFENCDSITIDGKYIGEFLVDDLHTRFMRTASNCIGKMETVDTFAIEIHKDANKERFAFNQDDWEDYKEMVFDRIAYNDITQINFVLEEQYVEEGKIPCMESQHYTVSWIGDDEYINEAQTTYASKCGNLYVVISKDKGIEDFFDFDEIDDSEEIDFKFKMYGYDNEDKIDVIEELRKRIDLDTRKLAELLVGGNL